jgi:hypothetical protein
MTESRYARLLRLYPAGHPRDEMLGVLLESGRPVHREVLPLVFGALRARSGGDQSLAVRWLYAARAAALILLVWEAIGNGDGLSEVAPAPWAAVAAALLVVAGARRPALGFALTAFIAGLVTADHWTFVTGLGLAAALLAIPGPRTPVANPLLVALAVAIPVGDPPWLPIVVLFAFALWAVVDERLLLAFGFVLSDQIFGFVSAAMAGIADGEIWRYAVQRLLIPAACVAVGAAIAASRARV